jgi:hypothetical protein
MSTDNINKRLAEAYRSMYNAPVADATDEDEELDEANISMKKHAQQVASNFSLLDSLNEQINDYFGDNWKMSSDKVFVAELKKLLTKEIKEIR